MIIFTGREIPGVSGRAETQLFNMKDWADAGSLDNLEATIESQQDASEKAEKMLKSGASEREAAKEANITRYQARRISESLSDAGCAAKRDTIASQPHPTISESIINLLSKGQLTTSEIVDRVNGSRTAIMDELKALRDAKSVNRVKQGLYSLTPQKG